MKKNFTLIELLVYISVLTILILVFASFFLLILRINTKTKAMRETLNSAKRAMEIMTLEIREAKSIYLPTSLFTTTTGQISLETEKYLPEGEIFSFVDFYLCEKQLCFKKEGQNPIALTSDNVEINNLEFELIATTSTKPSVKITLQVDYKNPQSRPELAASIILTSTASLRSE